MKGACMIQTSRDDGAGRKLDAIDRRICAELSRDATLPYAELSSRVGLSAAAVHERVRRLRASEVIVATVARLDGAAMGRPMLCFVMIRLHDRDADALRDLSDWPEVEEVHVTTGADDAMVKLRCGGPEALDDLLRRIARRPEVRELCARPALRTLVERGPSAELSAD